MKEEKERAREKEEMGEKYSNWNIICIFDSLHNIYTYIYVCSIIYTYIHTYIICSSVYNHVYIHLYIPHVDNMYGPPKLFFKMFSRKRYRNEKMVFLKFD